MESSDHMRTSTKLPLATLVFSLGCFAHPTLPALQEAGISFEPNVGQGDPKAEYITRGTGYQLGIRKNGTHLNLRTKHGVVQVETTFPGANTQNPWQALEPTTAKANYFHGTARQWKTNIPLYARLRQANIFPGVDLVYYGNQNRLEYDWLVQPGSDPKSIRMHFQGIKGLSVDGEGNLILETAAGKLFHHKPLAYQLHGQTQTTVPVRFELTDRGDVRFQVGAYDSAAVLRIDPTVAFASYVGGSGNEQGNAIATDSAGNIYITGSTTSTKNGDSDVLIRKYGPSGSLLFTADLGGTGDDSGTGIQVDAAGTIYVTGTTASSDFPLASASQSTKAGTSDAFLLRMNANGNGFMFSTLLGGSGADLGKGLAIDSQGAAYITGTAGSDFPTTQGSYQPSNRGGKDAFVAKFTAQGVKSYVTLLGGGSDDEGNAIAVDTQGNAYITGSSESDDFPQVNNTFQHSRHGQTDIVVAELNPSGGGVIYSTLYGGLFSDVGYGIAVGRDGSAYITGKTASLDFVTTNNGYQRSYQGGDNDMFILQMNPGQGNPAYSTYLGSGGTDEAFAIAIDSDGTIYVAGNSDSSGFPIQDPTQATRKGNRDAIVVKLNPSSTGLQFSTYMGGSLNDVGYGIAVDSSKNAYVTGITSSTDFPANSGSAQSSNGGGSDAYFAKILFSSSTGAPTISSGGIVNGATFASGAVAPGSVISIFGTNFIASAVSAQSLPLPTNLNGTAVLINGSPAPLYYVGPTQINAQVPNGLSAGNITLQITTPAGTTATTTFQVIQAAPYLTLANNRAVAVNGDGTLNTTANPAKVGSTIVVYFTGIGPVNATLVDGAASPNAISTLPTSATFGTTSATLTYVGLSPGSVGLAQANVQVPAIASGDAQFTLRVGGKDSNAATIAVTQ